MDKGTKVAVLGCGNLGSSIARGIAAAKLLDAPSQIILSRRNTSQLAHLQEEGFTLSTSNIKAVKESQIIFICVLPQALNGLLDEIRSEITKTHVIISVVSGAPISDIIKRLSLDFTPDIVRAMPNTAIRFRESMTCLAAIQKNEGIQIAINIFDALGSTLVVEEDLLVAATALCACGIAFFCRAIRAASQGGTQIGFHSEDAIKLAAQTAKGAATLILESGSHPEEQVDKVTTPQGCTIIGLNEMEHSGFSSAFIKGIVTSAEKAKVLYKQKESKSSGKDE